VDIPDSEQYRSPARSDGDDDYVTPEEELRRIQEEQLTLGVEIQEPERNDSPSEYQTDDENYNSLIRNTIDLIQENRR